MIFFDNAPNQSFQKLGVSHDSDCDEPIRGELPFLNAEPECKQTTGTSVLAADTFMIPANSECVIPVKFKEHALAETIGLIESNTTLASRFNVCVSLLFLCQA